jgi:hypothetical protein
LFEKKENKKIGIFTTERFYNRKIEGKRLLIAYSSK